MNSPGVVRMMHAARKVGVTSVPLNYRLTPEEAAYIVDDCDAVAVYVDAEFAAHFAQVRRAHAEGAALADLRRRRARRTCSTSSALVTAASDAPPEVDRPAPAISP